MTQPIIDVLTRAGGFARRPTLAAVASNRQIKRAVGEGSVLRTRRGRYELPNARDHRIAAHRMSAFLSHRRAALHWGWKVQTVPRRPEVTVGRHRTVSPADQSGATVHWRALAEDDVVDGVTSPLRTVLDCARDLRFDEALSVADSALRSNVVRQDELRDVAALGRGWGAARVRRVAELADRRADNPFESVLRAIALDVSGFSFVPQLQITGPGLFAVVDLGDPKVRLALEADSYEHHGGRREHHLDCERYDELVVHGWTVLRFTWEMVMLHPEYVRWCLTSLAGSLCGRPVPARPGLPDAPILE